jgi:hypothetical protein
MTDGINEPAAIRELLATYALTLDVNDLDGCLELFTDDGEFEVYGKTLSRERIHKMFSRAPHGMHLTGAVLIDVSGADATVRSQVLFVDSRTHEMRPAIYDDVLVNVAGRWRFRRRRCQFITASGLSDRPLEPEQ